MSRESGQDLVIISGEFGRYPSSIEHMVRRLAEHHRVLWVEVTGMRRPKFNLYDLRRAVGKVIRLAKGAHRVESEARSVPTKLHLTSPITIPMPELAIARGYNDRSIAQAIILETQRLGFRDFGLITSLPMASRTFARFKASRQSNIAWTMYYCPDEWALWPGMNAELVRTWEKELLANVDCVVASSERLRVTKSTDDLAAHVLPHGVDVDHFSKSYSNSVGKRIKFFGMFDDRIDQRLLVALATEFPEFDVEMIGPVQAQLVEGMPKNVVFTGPVSYDSLPARLADAALLIMPYVRNELTDNINPLKGRECLATGKPLLATALPELVNMGGVFTAESTEQFIGMAKQILTGQMQYDGLAAIEAMRQHSWDARAVELLRMGQSSGR